MINDLQTINTNDYDTMAKAMGIANEKPATPSQQSSLARVKIPPSPLLSKTAVKGQELKDKVTMVTQTLLLMLLVEKCIKMRLNLQCMA